MGLGSNVLDPSIHVLDTPPYKYSPLFLQPWTAVSSGPIMSHLSLQSNICLFVRPSVFFSELLNFVPSSVVLRTLELILENCTK